MPSIVVAGLLAAFQVLPGHADHQPRSPSLTPEPDGVAAPAGTVVGPAETLWVGPDGDHTTLSAAVAASSPGDTIRLAAGVYRERVVVPHPLVLLGEPGAVIDAGGEGTVLRMNDCPGSVVRGLTLRGSGRDVSREDSGLLARRCPGLVVEEIRVLDTLFGIYLKESREAVVRGNQIVGKELPVNRRGDGIRYWYSSGGRIEGNRLRRSRDVVIWFSDSLEVRDNVIRDGRYGLHYMYSDHNLFHGNRFEGNLVGAFLMYSAEIRFSGNVFAASKGASGMGLGLKDADDIQARNNVFVANAVGIYLDNSPRSTASRNLFRGNVLALNDVGISLLPSVRANAFLENDFRENVREVVVSGGGDALKNSWRGNFWSAYAGFDRDDDGVGDTPFVLSRLSDRLLTGHRALELFHLSPAAGALDVLARVLPFLEPRPVVVDSMPRLEMKPAPAVAAAETGAGGGGRLAAGALLILALAAGSGVARFRRLAARG